MSDRIFPLPVSARDQLSSYAVWNREQQFVDIQSRRGLNTLLKVNFADELTPEQLPAELCREALLFRSNSRDTFFTANAKDIIALYSLTLVPSSISGLQWTMINPKNAPVVIGLGTDVTFYDGRTVLEVPINGCKTFNLMISEDLTSVTLYDASGGTIIGPTGGPGPTGFEGPPGEEIQGEQGTRGNPGESGVPPPLPGVTFLSPLDAVVVVANDFLEVADAPTFIRQANFNLNVGLDTLWYAPIPDPQNPSATIPSFPSMNAFTNYVDQVANQFPLAQSQWIPDMETGYPSDTSNGIAFVFDLNPGVYPLLSSQTEGQVLIDNFVAFFDVASLKLGDIIPAIPNYAFYLQEVNYSTSNSTLPVPTTVPFTITAVSPTTPFTNMSNTIGSMRVPLGNANYPILPGIFNTNNLTSWIEFTLTTPYFMSPGKILRFHAVFDTNIGSTTGPAITVSYRGAQLNYSYQYTEI